MKTPEPAPGPVAPPPGMSDTMRQRMIQENPDIRFGSVIAVRPQDRLAAVSGIPITDVGINDTVAFYAQGQVINIGQVVRIVHSDIHVHYNVPGMGQRDPQVGDVAVAFKHAGK